MRSNAAREAEQRYRDRNPMVRISDEAHSELIKYSTWSGLSVKDIVSNMVVEHVENYCNEKIQLVGLDIDIYDKLIGYSEENKLLIKEIIRMSVQEYIEIREFMKKTKNKEVT